MTKKEKQDTKEESSKKGDSEMKNVEKIKQNMKEAYAKKVDFYFSRFEELREKR